MIIKFENNESLLNKLKPLIGYGGEAKVYCTWDV
jgi:hypothetical protein